MGSVGVSSRHSYFQARGLSIKGRDRIKADENSPDLKPKFLKAPSRKRKKKKTQSGVLTSLLLWGGERNKRRQQWQFSTDDKQRYKREHHTGTIHHHSWCFSFTQMASQSFFSEMCEWCLQPSIIKGHNGGWGSRRDLDTPGSSLLDLLICYLTPARALPNLKKTYASIIQR